MVYCGNFFISYHFLYNIVTHIHPIPTERNAPKKFFKTYYYTGILYTIGHSRGKTWKLSISVIYVDSMEDMCTYLHNNLCIYINRHVQKHYNIVNIQYNICLLLQYIDMKQNTLDHWKYIICHWNICGYDACQICTNKCKD